VESQRNPLPVLLALDQERDDLRLRGREAVQFEAPALEIQGMVVELAVSGRGPVSAALGERERAAQHAG
jgi:hypothetical protein